MNRADDRNPMRRTPEPAIVGRNLVEEVNLRITSFVNTFRLVLFAAGLLAVVGLVLRYYAVTGGNAVFVIAMVGLVLLFMIQIGLSFFYIIANLKLAFLGAVGSFALMLGSLALIFRYQNWWGWQFMFFVAIPIYMISSIFLGMYLARKRALRPMQRKFLYQNLLLPFLFLLFLAILSFALDTDPRRQENPFRDWSRVKTDEWIIG